MMLAVLITLIAAFLVLVALSWSDLRRGVLPDALIGLLGVLACVFHILTDWTYLTPFEALAGGLLGSATLYLIRAAYALLRNREGLGLGDVKFMVAAGLWVGGWNLATLLGLGAGLTLLMVAVHRFVKSRGSVLSDETEIPLGPGLCFALLVVAISLIYNA